MALSLTDDCRGAWLISCGKYFRHRYGRIYRQRKGPDIISCRSKREVVVKSVMNRNLSGPLQLQSGCGLFHINESLALLEPVIAKHNTQDIIFFGGKV